MQYTIYKTLFLCLAGVCLYGVVQAQHAVSLDSLPLFYGTADETGGSYAPPVLKTKGRVTHVAANADGSISIAAFRQYVGYLDASPTKGLPMSPNALPGLVQYRYEPATGLQQVSAGIFNLNGGLSQPIPYKLFDIVSNRGTINNKQPIATAEGGLDYPATLAAQPQALNYDGDSPTLRRLYVREGQLRYQTQGRYYAPYAATYFAATPVAERVLRPVTNPNSYLIDYTNLRALVREGSSLNLIDTTGQATKIDLPVEKGMVVKVENHYAQSSGEGLIDTQNINGMLGLDMLFGPPKVQQDSSYVFVRTDKQGRVVCRHPFKLSVEEGYISSAMGSWMIGNEKEALIRLEFGKGLLKLMAYYIKISAEKGVVYIRKEEKEEQRKARIRSAGGVSSNRTNEFYHLVSLPNGDNLAVGLGSTTGMGTDYYCTVHVTAAGMLKNYYVHGRQCARSQLSVARVPQCISLKDGRVLLMADEPWISPMAYQPYGLLDVELASSFSAQLQTLGVAGKPNVHFNAAMLQRPLNNANSSASRLLNTLDRLSGDDPRSSGRTYADKRQQQVEPEQYATRPILYWIDLRTEDVEIALGPGGFVIPQQSYGFYDHAKNEMTFVLRSYPYNQLRPIKGVPMQGVFLKVYRWDLSH